MARQLTSTEKIYRHLQRTDPVLGVEKLSFQLLCAGCGETGHVPAKKQTIMHPGFIRKAAMSFASDGWDVEESPICPSCKEKT